MKRMLCNVIGALCFLLSAFFAYEGRGEVIWGGFLFVGGVCLFLVSTIYSRHNHYKLMPGWLLGKTSSLSSSLSWRQRTNIVFCIVACIFCLPFVNNGINKGTLTFVDAVARIGSTALLVAMLDFCIVYIFPVLLAVILLPKEKERVVQEQVRNSYVFTRTRKVFLFSGVGTGVCSAIAYALGIEVLAGLSFVVSLVALAHLA